MKFYAIKHLPSGGFLPSCGSRGGATFKEPSTTEAPRLFTLRRGAASALVWYLRGEVTSTVAYEYDDMEEIQNITPRPDRKKEDYTIVEVEVVEVEPRMI